MTSGLGLPGQRTSKKLMARVRPGVELVRAILDSTRVLITLDLPTLERPRKATSGSVGAGKCAGSVAEAVNRAITLMLKFATGRGNWQGKTGHVGVVRRPRVELHSTESRGRLYLHKDCRASTSAELFA